MFHTLAKIGEVVGTTGTFDESHETLAPNLNGPTRNGACILTVHNSKANVAVEVYSISFRLASCNKRETPCEVGRPVNFIKFLVVLVALTLAQTDPVVPEAD